MARRHLKCKIVDDGIYLYDPDKKSCSNYLCGNIFVSAVYENVLTNEQTEELTFFCNDSYKKIIISRSLFTAKKLLEELIKFGFDITERTADKVLYYVLMTEEKVEVKFYHTNLGWANIDHKRVFLLSQSIGSVKKSEYKGDLEIFPKGNLKGWLEGVQTEVIGNLNLELVMVLGFSAPLASLLGQLCGIKTLFFHIFGTSTMGKTTSVALATSIFGLPTDDNNGLIKSYMATHNALMANISNLHGICLAFDEAGIANVKFSTLIYEIAGGIQKARSDKDGKVRARDQHSGTFLSTGETSLFNEKDRSEGQLVRNLELKSLQFTNSGEHSLQIKKFIREHYGHAGTKFVKQLLKFSDDEVMEMFNKCKAYILSKIKPTRFSERISETIATIRMTAKIAKTVFELEIDVEAITDLLCKIQDEQFRDGDIGTMAYEHLLTEINKNLNKFLFKDKLESFDIKKRKSTEKELPKSDIWGKIESSGGIFTEALIPSGILRNILEKGGFKEPQVILEAWRAKAYIECDDGKFTKKRNIYGKGISVRVVVVKLNNPKKAKMSNKTP